MNGKFDQAGMREARAKPEMFDELIRNKRRKSYMDYSADQLVKFMDRKRESDNSYTWDRLAVALGVSPSSMSLIKNKKMALSVQFVQIAADELGCNPLDFFPPDDKGEKSDAPRESLMVVDLRRALKAAARVLATPAVEKAGDLAIRALQSLEDYPSSEDIDSAIKNVLIEAL
jgi:transcriptional regulator with XRE-family HTH domain